MTTPGPELIQPRMLRQRSASDSRRGAAGSGRLGALAERELEQIRFMRWHAQQSWTTPTALPDSLDQLAELLADLGWYDLVVLARREEVAVCRELDARAVPPQGGPFTDRSARVLAALLPTLRKLERYEEALAVTDELQRLGTPDHLAETRRQRAALLGLVGRHEEAARSAAEEVASLRLRGVEGAELRGALSTYACHLDDAGRVAEAAEVSGEAEALLRTDPDAGFELARAVDGHSDRLLRAGRTEEARRCLTDALPGLHRYPGADRWPNFWYRAAARLLALDLPAPALDAAEVAVRSYRKSVDTRRAQHRQVAADRSWDEDHRFAQAHLEKWRAEKLAEAWEGVRDAELLLHKGLLVLADCLRPLDRAAEAAEAGALAAVALAASEAADTATPFRRGTDDAEDEDAPYDG